MALRGVLSLGTHIDSRLLLAFACGEKYVQGQHVSSTLHLGNHMRSNGRETETDAQRERERGKWGVSCGSEVVAKDDVSQRQFWAWGLMLGES